MKFKLFFSCLAWSALLAGNALALPDGTSNIPSGMVIDLGEASPYVKVTPEYTKAAVTSVLPYFSDAAEKLNLPISTPIKQSDILRGHALPFRDLSVSIMLKSGWSFTYSMGMVHLIVNSSGFSALQDPRRISDYYGQVKMTQNEAVALARSDLQKLGIPLEQVFADQEPVVTLPKIIGTNIIADYEIQWLDPRRGPCVDIHINAEKRQLDRFYILSKSLRLLSPKLDMTPETDPFWPSVNPEYARQLIPIMFQAIGDYARKLSLPVPLPLTTNNVARVEIADNEGWPQSEITLTNGWHFTYRHTMVNGCYSPDVFFSINNPDFHLKNFQGKWNMNEEDAVQLVKNTLAKLHFPTNNIHMNFEPLVIYAQGDFKKTVPRCLFQWYYQNATHDDLQSKVEAEVNADNGTLESLYYDDKAYWDTRPAITVPISNAKSYPTPQMNPP